MQATTYLATCSSKPSDGGPSPVGKGVPLVKDSEKRDVVFWLREGTVGSDTLGSLLVVRMHGVGDVR